jgi:ferrous iron transport protein B
MSTALTDPPASATRVIHAVLAGNPNAGKTSIFNNLTGAHQKVANYPGVTVETVESEVERGDTLFRLVDLPGTYSLTANSPEERIARDYILDHKPDVVVQVIDSANLERSLYLTVQLRELGVRLVLDLNMFDEAEARGMHIDCARLAERLGVEVVTSIGNRGLGTPEILDAIERASQMPLLPCQLRFNESTGRVIEKLVLRLAQANGSAQRYPLQWAAIKCLEGDREIWRWLEHDVHDGTAIGRKTSAEINWLKNKTGESIESLIAQARYLTVNGIYKNIVKLDHPQDHGDPLSEKIDAVLLHRVWGLPIFLLTMYLMFQFTFTLGQYPMDLIDGGFNALGGWLGGAMPDGPLRSLLVDGIIAGVGGVIVFLPNILLLFFFIGLLEKSGYMARAAFLMDRVMNKVGLHGRSFIPLLTGFGCSIPAIMATRTLEHERDRLATMMVVPLMSCSARLVIYMFLIPAFFAVQLRGLVFFSMYAIGIVLAVVLVKLLRISLLKGESTPFVMELPPYRRPTLRSILAEMWSKSRSYLKKAGTIILAISIVLWFAASYPVKKTFDIDRSPQAAQMTPGELSAAHQSEEIAYSVAGRIGHAMEPIFKPLGFDWRICTGLIGAFAAKEVFVAQMGIVYAVGDAEDDAGAATLRQQLQRRYPPLVAFCIMLFCLLSFPCISTFAIMRKESNSWKWAILQSGSYTALAYLLTLLIYQVGRAFGIGV